MNTKESFPLDFIFLFILLYYFITGDVCASSVGCVKCIKQTLLTLAACSVETQHALQLKCD